MAIRTEQLKGTLFWIPASVLSALTLSWLIWLEIRPEPTICDYATNGDLERLEQAVAANPDLEALNQDGLTILACAAKGGPLDAVRMILRAGADVNGCSSDGSTALHFAVERDDLEMIRTLLDAGADLYLKNLEGISPLCLAVQRNGFAVSFFLESGANLDQDMPPSGAGCPGYLFCAAKSGCMPVLLKMLPGESGINRRSAQGVTALLYAAHEGRLDAMRLLIQQGADVNVIDRLGWTPLHHAVLLNRIDMIHLLLENGAELEVRDTDGHTPLLMAAQKGQANVFCELMIAGADIDAKDDEMLGAEDLARAAHQPEILQLIAKERLRLKARRMKDRAVF